MSLRLALSTVLALWVSLLLAAGADAAGGAQSSTVGWGYDAAGELGGGYTGPAVRSPVSVLEGASVTQLAASGGWSAALLEDGTVETWGGNEAGQLGDGGTVSSPTPVAVSGLTGRVTQIAIAGEHAIALLENGTVETWGQNGYGTLGIGTTGYGSETCCHSTVAVPVPGLHGIVQVAAGGADDAVLTADGHVYAWGENHTGQLGDGTTVEKDSPTLVPGLEHVRSIALGGLASVGAHLVALLDDGTVRALGSGGQGQLGDGVAANSSSPVTVSGLSGVTQISSAPSHTLALRGDGSVWAWGSDEFGELGSAVAGTCGRKALPCATTPIPVPLPGASAVAAGLAYSLAISGGRVYAWGIDRYGTLGDGAASERTAPAPVESVEDAQQVVAGSQHALASVAAGAPAQPVELHAGAGTLTVSVSASELSSPARVAYRLASAGVRGVRPLPFSARVKLSPSANSYTFAGLQAAPYEILVEGKTVGRRIVSATPLPG